MRQQRFSKAALSFVLTATLLASMFGCTVPQSETPGATVSPEERSGVYGDWQNSSSLLEEQLMRGSGTASSGVSDGNKEVATGAEGASRFRDTENGEPLAIHEFINRVLVDNEQVKITLHAKTADALGDAGFTLMIENRYRPLTPVGYDNYCYITPIMGTWTVNGVAMDPKTEGQIFPSRPGIIYLYFDELSSIEELKSVEGAFEIYLISDWWNPIDIYVFEEF